jgi:hypothetical protein
LPVNLPSIKIEGDHCTTSLYTGELTTQCIIDQVKAIKKAFPSLPAGFYDVLTDRINEHKFNDERLRDAVNHIIDTCIYPHPSIAGIISWDKRINVYTYHQIIDLVNIHGKKIWDEYKRVDIHGRSGKYFAHIIDIDKYNLKITKSKDAINNITTEKQNQ